MCGRYVSATPVEELASYFTAEPDADLGEAAQARYNVPPTAAVLGVVVDHRHGSEGEERAAQSTRDRIIRAFRWGLVPSWSKDQSSGARAFNARAESLATRPLYRAAFGARRLIVPATAFYEWCPAGRARQPFAFSRADGAPLAFAGLWEIWRPSPEAPWLRTLTIITTRAGADVAPVHDRQPVVLEPADFAAWLDPEQGDKALLVALLAPSPAGTLVAHEVGRAVGNPANEGPQLLEALGPERPAAGGASAEGARATAAGRLFDPRPSGTS